MSHELVYTRQAKEDAKKLNGTALAKEAKELLEIIRENPFTDRPPFEALVGDLKGAYSRRMNIQHRLVYEVLDDEAMDALLIETRRNSPPHLTVRRGCRALAVDGAIVDGSSPFWT